jgi:flavin-dependent dehydrogenase
MPQHSAVPTATRIVRRTAAPAAWRLEADICVAGSGIAGVSAALEAARIGRRVVLIDALPALGGQAVNSIIGTFCGLFHHGENRYPLTHGIADGILADLGAAGALHYRVGPEYTTVFYDEVALGRWIEQQVEASDIELLLGATLRRVHSAGRRVAQLDLATRYGDVEVCAQGFVDATGDAALAWNAGCACREPQDATVYGSQMVVVDNINPEAAPERDAFAARVGEVGARYGLVRADGIAFVFPARGTATVNITHVETPLEPLAASRCALEGKSQADRAVAFLRAEFPEAYGAAKVRAYGFPGIRQTRWIVGAHHLTVDEVRAGTRFDDAVARTAWPIELHNRQDGYIWESFDVDHLHYVPFRSLAVADADNLLAVGRCIDADLAALSSVRVMGPCIAMGYAAAHGLDLAAGGSVHDIDIARLQERVYDNVARSD